MCNLQFANLKGANLEGAVLVFTNLKGANLEGANLGGAYLMDAHLNHANLGGANLGGAYLNRANLNVANLEGANLKNAHLENTMPVAANLKAANLENAHLEGAMLIYANLESADLRNANLKDTSLESADLRNANLRGAKLEGASLKSANRKGAIMPDGTKHPYQPFTDFDLIGSLSQSLARQRQADFMAVSAQKLCGKFPELKGCSYLLFATHPLRELEKDIPSDTAKYLTYYAFSNNFNQPVNLNGASADDVHEMISFLENQTIQDGILLSSGVINQAKSAGQAISGGLQTSLSMDEGFLDEESSYFAPIPVALIAIVDTNLEATEANSEIIHEKFVELASQWTQDVEVMSSTVEMTKHPAYQEIVSMGQAVIPFLLEDLSQNPLLRQRSSRNRL